MGGRTAVRIPVVLQEEMCATMIRHAKQRSTTLTDTPQRLQRLHQLCPARPQPPRGDERNRKGRDRRFDQTSIKKVCSAAHQSVRQSTPDVDGAKRRGKGWEGRDHPATLLFSSLGFASLFNYLVI